MSIFGRIEKLLEGEESFVLAALVSRSGSAPRNAGAKMVVRQDGSIIGTIGGGLVEAQVRDLAKEVLGDRKSVFRMFSFTAEEAAQKGMICGGQVKVLVHFVDALQSSNRTLYQQIAETLRSQKHAWLITAIPSEGEESEAPPQCLVSADGTLGCKFDQNLIQALTADPACRAELVAHGGKLFFVERLCRESAVFIFGAGHVSQMLAPLTRLVGFRTVVVDDRSEFANRERFATADEIIVPASFEQAMDGLDIDETSCLVLVTRGHVHDKTVLRQALRTKAGYIGMIGSRRKRNALYDALCEEGFPRSEFDRVCAPIGLEIGAESPEEIAVSIVAELIRFRAKKNQ